MTVDPAVLPGLLLLVAELVALAAVGYVVVRVVLRQADERMALAQGLIVGPALWGLIVAFFLYVFHGRAGAIAGWVVLLTLGVVLAWRATSPIRLRPRVVAGFIAAFLALFWAALASRQLITVTDPYMVLGLASSIRAGGFPPELPWVPGTPAPYPYGTALLIGLLTPPSGPDLALVHELISAYAWTSMVLVVVTLLLRLGSWMAALVLGPLLISHGLWTLLSWDAGAVQLPVPAGLPEAGLRASLGDVYWPTVELSPALRLSDVLPEIWKPAFLLAYALAYVVLERAARLERWSWRASLTLAGLVGFLGLLSPTLASGVGLVWAGLAVMHFMRHREAGSVVAALRSGMGPALAVLLLIGAGGAFSGILSGESASGLTLRDGLSATQWQALGLFDARPGGVGVLGVGPLAAAAVAVALARRDRLVVALAAGAVLLAVAWVALDYPPLQWNINRFAGHARNLALVALALALAIRLADFRPARRRYAAALVAILITWPTVVEPARSLGLAIGNGVQLANEGSVHDGLPGWGEPASGRRFGMPAISDRVADHIRDHLAVDARVFAARDQHVFYATGRPNNAGFANATNLNYGIGAEYLDVRDFLEPAAVRRLGLEYVYATDDWEADLPDRAARWLADPRLFELLVRDGAEALYRIRPAFLELDVAPHPQTFEALRAVPPSTVVHLAPQVGENERLLIASVLSHARLLGYVDVQRLHLRSPAPWTVEPLDEQTPDLVVLPASIEPWTRMFPAAGRQPIWQNGRVAVYAPNGGFASITPPGPAPEALPVSVRVTSTGLEQGRVTFEATFTEHAPERWTGQDWVVVPVADGPWAIPDRFLDGGRGPKVARWFAGLISPESAATMHTYQFDAPTSTLAVRSESGTFVPLEASDGKVGAGSWMLALRLQHEWQPNIWREAAFIPVIRFQVSEAGEVSYAVFDDVHGRALP